MLDWEDSCNSGGVSWDSEEGCATVVSKSTLSTIFLVPWGGGPINSSTSSYLKVSFFKSVSASYKLINKYIVMNHKNRPSNYLIIFFFLFYFLFNFFFLILYCSNSLK